MSQNATERELLAALSDLRLALPSSLILLLLVRFSAHGFINLMNRIQAQGWTENEDERPARAASTSKTNDTEDEVRPVVVPLSEMRRSLVLALFWFSTASYFAEGVAQIVATLITHEFTPAMPQYTNVLPYILGGFVAFSLCAIAMSYERSANKDGAWGSLYPRAFTVLALGQELALVIVFAQLLRIRKASTVLDHFVVAILATRILFIFLLALSQTPLFYKRSFVPWKNPHSQHDEREPLLNGHAENGNGNDYGSTTPPKINLPKNLLRASLPPSTSPPDPKSLNITTLFSRVRTLFPYLWPSKSIALQVLAIICVGLMLLRRVLNVIVPFLFGRIVEDLSMGRPPYLNIGLYVLADFLKSSNTMLYQYLWLPIEQYSEREMTMMSFDCLLNLSLAYHTKRKTGELLRILDRGDALNNFFQQLIFTFIPVLIDIPVAVVVLSVQYGALIVSIVSSVSIIFVVASIILAESRTKLYRTLRDEGQYMRQIQTDTLFNWETVKIFTAEKFATKSLENALRTYQRGYFQVYSAWNSLSLIQDAISAFGLLICAFVLAHRVVTGEIGIGLFVTFISYLSQLYGPLNQIAGLYKNVQRNLVDTEQLMELLKEDKDVVDGPDAVDLDLGDGDGSIEFKDVKFSYDGKQDTIKGVSFSVKAGHSVALVGPSGGGKSTIMRLLYRFYDVKEGSISINGQDIRDVTQASLRRVIGLVPQDSVLFNETVRYNLAFGGGVGITAEQMIDAAKSSAIHDKIMGFPDQYETRVGERGQRLSGGEKQRVAIARVLLKDPSILLLDEATSALDTANERMIQTRLRELSKGRTTLAIAHRLSTITDCDVIHVLSEGVIAESGSHQELLALGGIYADLWAKQSETNQSATPSGVNTPRTRTATPLPTEK